MPRQFLPRTLVQSSASVAVAFCAVLFAPQLGAQESWELSCSVDGPKTVALPRLADASDAGSATIAQYTYAYAILTIENSSENPAPLAVAVRVQPIRDDVASARPAAALLAQDAVLAAIRAAESDEELVDVYRAGSLLEAGASTKLVAILGRDVIPTSADGELKRAMNFADTYDLIVSGLKFAVADSEGRRVATAEDWVARGTFSEGSFSLGSGEFRSADAEAKGIDLGPVQETWSRDQIDNFLQAWTLDLQVERPRPVMVTEPPSSSRDLRSVRERSRAFWYVRARVSNNTGATRPLALTARILTRNAYDVDDLILRELEDPNLHPTRRRIYEQQIQQRELLPIRNPDAFRAAAAQEVERHGAIYGPVDFFSLPSTIEPLEEGMDAMREMLRSGPKGAFDVIILFSGNLDPGITEFEVRLGGTRNRIDWLDPETKLPTGDFHERELFRVVEEHASRFRRMGSDAILEDPFQLSSTRWVRLYDGSGLKSIDLVEPVKVGG